MNARASTIAQAVKARRQRLGLRQEQAAALAGVSTRFVHAVEAGKESLRLDKLLDLFEALGLALVLRSGATGVSYEAPSGDST
ncbi:MAG: helix-turn-helix transcriptional regulator [Deltaproteobacteria bacterium]|nr:helix-turn-helix transcriptional regulator [Deltaproteobacteria bacterium]